MGGSRDTVVLFFGFFSLVVLLHGQNQSGFISIDCGIDEGLDYTDETTGLLYTSDAKFIETGINGKVSSELMSDAKLGQRLRTVRSFPDGDKNCYTLRPTRGKDHKYLIRVAFFYGNYDSKNQTPEFDLHLGVEKWQTISGADIGFMSEIIHVPETDDIYVCLVNTGSGTPFISLIELRPLNDSTYATESGSLELFARVDPGFSTTNDTIIRYKDDVYDRRWFPVSWDEWTPISAGYVSGSLSDNEYRPPPVVMSTAVIPKDDRYPLEFYWETGDMSQKYYAYMYFAEVENLGAGETREFTISLNDFLWSDPIIPKMMSPTTVSNPSAISASGNLSFSITKTDRSTRPPILNALEVYSVRQFSQSPTGQMEVEAIKGIKSVYKVKQSSWQGDPCLPRNYSWGGLICRDNGYDAPNIISLNLSSSNFSGKIIDSFSNLTWLQYLDLSHNNLSGELPAFLAELPSLKALNLSWNNFTGSVPPQLIEKSNDGTLSLSLDGNPNLCTPNSCEVKKKKHKNVVVVVPIVSSVFVLVPLGALAVFWIYKRKRKQGVVTAVKPKDQQGKVMGQNSRHISYKDIVTITNNFKEMIGRGGSGKVYSGHLSDGTPVAVKMLSYPSYQGSKECCTEAQLLTRIHHRNLVTLLGYCEEDENMGLIYEYMANGSLQEYLSGTKTDAMVLSWEQRLRIAVDAAQALEYLHSGCKPPIIHRDVKTANILLDEKLQAKVADFGLSKCLPVENGSYLSTVVAGTPGYLDPEYYATTRLNEKSDVYSFGIVLLELVTGRPPIIKEGDSFVHIVQWVSPILERGEIRDVVDQRLVQGEFEMNSVWKAVDTAMACVARGSATRPTMSHVLQELKGCLNIEIARERTGRFMREDDDSEGQYSSTFLECIFASIDQIPQGPQER